MKVILTWIIVLLIFTEAGCSAEDYVCYETRCYAGADGILNDIQSTARFMSYGDALLEFRLKVNIYDSLTEKGERFTVRVDYDTIGCFYIDSKTRQYYQLDTFASKHRVIGKGSFKDKPAGLPIPDSAKSLDNELLKGSIRDSLVGGLLWKAADFKVDLFQDGQPQKAIICFRDDLKFNSIFKYTSFLSSRSSWEPVSYFWESIEAKEAYLMRIEEFTKPVSSSISIFKSIQKTIKDFQKHESKK